MKKKTEVSLSRAHIYYTGRVQGVGFRYESESLAHKVGGLTGFVKNLPDGRVELICEGEKKKIEKLLLDIRQSCLGRHIRKTDCNWEAPTNEFDDFTIEFHL